MDKFQARKALVGQRLRLPGGEIRPRLCHGAGHEGQLLQHGQPAQDARTSWTGRSRPWKIRGTPVIGPIRGGTDGARLTYMGLPCPNLSTGGMNGHSRRECACVESMDKMVEVLLRLVTAR